VSYASNKDLPGNNRIGGSKAGNFPRHGEGSGPAPAKTTFNGTADSETIFLTSGNSGIGGSKADNFHRHGG
jgi:hypothetical protein